MTAYMKLNGIRIFDYPTSFSSPLRNRSVRMRKRLLTKMEWKLSSSENSMLFEKMTASRTSLPKPEKRKVSDPIFSAMECCNTYRPWHDKTTGKTFLKFDQSKCLHYYFYFIDMELGLCYLRVPTWPPFRLQFYMNGHNLLAYKLDKNSFLTGCRTTRSLKSPILKLLRNFLTVSTRKGSIKFSMSLPDATVPFRNLGLGYTWTVQQIECATDIMFRKPEYLAPIYDEINIHCCPC